MCVHLMSVCGLKEQRKPGCRERNKDWEVFEHDSLQVEGVDSSLNMQNGLAGKKKKKNICSQAATNLI